MLCIQQIAIIKVNDQIDFSETNIVNTEFSIIHLKIYSLEKILKLIKRRAQQLKYKEHKVALNKARLLLFKKKGVDCVRCGAKGLFFAIDVPLNNKQKLKPVLNLWAIQPSGKHILMTRDHILPESKGGWSATFNLDPLCHSCNQKKADKFNKIQYLRHFILKSKYLFVEYFTKSIKKIVKYLTKLIIILEEYNT